MKKTSLHLNLSARPLLLGVSVALILSSNFSNAANATWANNTSNADALWTTGANWLGGSVPGGAGSVQSQADTATFQNAASIEIPVLDVDRSIAGLIINNSGADYSIQRSGTPILSIAGSGISISNGGTTAIDPVVRLVNGQGWNTGATAFTLNNGLEVNTASTLTLTNSNAVEVKGVVQGFSTAITGNANSPSSSASNLILSGGGSMLVSGVVQNNGLGTSTTGITSNDVFTGRLTLNNAGNSFTGAILWQGGTLAVGGNAPSGANGVLGNSTSAVVVGANTAVSGTAAMLTTGAYTVGRNINTRIPGGSTTQVVVIGGEHTTGTSTYSGAIGLGRTTVLTAASGGQVDFTGVISTVSGTAGINKSGDGIVRLTGSNTYTGGTTVSAGTLLVSNSAGSGVGSGGVAVNAGATLGGTGTLIAGAGNSLVVSGNVAPGDSGIGILTLNGANTAAAVLTVNSGGAFKFELNSTGPGNFQSDRIALVNGASGDIAFNSTVIDFTDLSAGNLAIGNYVLFAANVANAFSGLTLSGSTITSGLTFTGLDAYAGSTLQISGNDIILNVVPEPSVGGLIGVGLTFVLLLRKRSARLFSL